MTTTFQNLTIHQIEKLTENEVAANAIEKAGIKGHDVYFTDLGDVFSYSALVFFDGAYIKYANQYELHFRGKTREALRALYIEILNNTLFTDDEICGSVASHEDFKQKEKYLINYYPLRKPYVSAFFIGKENEPDTSGMIFDPVSYSYFDPTFRGFVKEHIALYDALKSAMNAAQNDYDYLVSAFLHEMYNHEYGYNWSGDADVLSVFGYRNFTDLNDVERRAYNTARAKYFEKFEG